MFGFHAVAKAKLGEILENETWSKIKFNPLINKTNFNWLSQLLIALAMCQRFGDLFLFELVWQYSSVQTKYNKGRFKVMATYLQQ